MDVSVIIVNYNTLKMTSECIDSIIQKTRDLTYEIILVDNASTDGSREFFEKDNRIIYVYNKTNLGFGSANNIGIKIAKGKFIFFLNSDTLLLNNAIKHFVEFESKNNNNLALGGWLLNSYMEISHSYGSFITLRGELQTALRVFTDRIPFLNKNKFDNEKYSDAPLKVDYITGADLFVPKEILDKVGLFDEDFFMYCEETDLQKRMQIAGYNRMLINDPRIQHLEQGSQKSGFISNKKNPRKLLMSTKSTLRYLKKYNGFFAFSVFKWVYFSLRFVPMLFNEYKWKYKLQYFMLFL